MKQSIAFFTIILLALSGCQSPEVESDESNVQAQHFVREVPHEAAVDCEGIGVGTGYGQGDYRATINLKNRVQNHGGNWVKIVDKTHEPILGGTTIKGLAYKCPTEAIVWIEQCHEGQFEKCLNYIQFALSKDAVDVAYKYAKISCSFQHKRSCDFVKKVDDTASKDLIKCNQNKSGESCYEYSYYSETILKDNIEALIFLKKACKYKNEYACDRIAYLNEIEAQKEKQAQVLLKERDEFRKDELVRIERQKASIQADRELRESLRNAAKFFGNSESESGRPKKKTKCVSRSEAILSGPQIVTDCEETN